MALIGCLFFWGITPSPGLNFFLFRPDLNLKPNTFLLVWVSPFAQFTYSVTSSWSAF